MFAFSAKVKKVNLAAECVAFWQNAQDSFDDRSKFQKTCWLDEISSLSSFTRIDASHINCCAPGTFGAAVRRS